MAKVFSRIFSATFVFSLISQLWHATAFRPYEDFTPTARTASLAGAGVAYMDSISAAVYNPAWFGYATGEYASFTLDGQATFNEIIGSQRLQFLNLPSAGANWFWTKNLASAVSWNIPYMRAFPDAESWRLYFFSTSLAYKINSSIALGASFGPTLGWINQNYNTTGFGYSFGLNWFWDGKRKFTFGIGVFGASELDWQSWDSGDRIKQTPPNRLQTGIAYRLMGGSRIFLDAHFTDWRASSFIRVSNKDTQLRPKDMDNGFGADSHLHLGYERDMPFFADVKVRGGLMTASYYDFEGKNEMQLQLTLGASFVAGGSGKKRKPKKKKLKERARNFYTESRIEGEQLFEERLTIDFAIVDSILLSAINDTNNLVEQFQVSANYRFSDWHKEQKKARKKKRARRKKKKLSWEDAKNKKRWEQLNEKKGSKLNPDPDADTDDEEEYEPEPNPKRSKGWIDF